MLTAEVSYKVIEEDIEERLEKIKSEYFTSKKLMGLSPLYKKWL